jgi:hypothetical protein
MSHRVHILLSEGNPISLVFQNIDPHPPSPPGKSVLPPQQRLGWGYTLTGRRGGWGVNILEDKRNRIASYSNGVMVSLRYESYHTVPALSLLNFPLACTCYEGHHELSFISRSRSMNTTRKDRTEQCSGDPFLNVDVQIL